MIAPRGPWGAPEVRTMFIQHNAAYVGARIFELYTKSHSDDIKMLASLSKAKEDIFDERYPGHALTETYQASLVSLSAELPLMPLFHDVGFRTQSLSLGKVDPDTGITIPESVTMISSRGLGWEWNTRSATDEQFALLRDHFAAIDAFGLRPDDSFTS